MRMVTLDWDGEPTTIRAVASVELTRNFSRAGHAISHAEILNIYDASY